MALSIAPIWALEYSVGSGVVIDSEAIPGVSKDELSQNT